MPEIIINLTYDQVGFKAKERKSSNLKSIKYSSDSKTLYITFVGGKTYAYQGVPVLVFSQIERGQKEGSHGSTFCELVRDARNEQGQPLYPCSIIENL